ncbi:hypothetical protein BX666DRAFT_1964026 [Dichotomocladium elegans]|nr:hypothetical protein BX666DRAFT_1964026 [Dichotomocladium elegans]
MTRMFIGAIIFVFGCSSLSNVIKATPLFRRVDNVDIQVLSETTFCSYLPPSPGLVIAEAEGEAVPFCTGPQSSPSTQTFPPGFIASAHFEQDDVNGFVQVTGRINPEAYDLALTDGGGQYDNKNEMGGTCNGYTYWVNLVEPQEGTFCIRCCQNKKDCNTGISEKGCERIVPGNYD